MTQEGFRRYLKTYIDAGIPFMAYWHPNGMGLIRLDEVEVPTKPPIEANVPAGRMPTKAHKLGTRGRRTWENNMARLRKQTWGQVITVEFDGKELKSEGGFEL